MGPSQTKSPDFFVINNFQPLGTFYSQDLCLLPPDTPCLQHDTSSSHLFDLPLNVYSHLWPSFWLIQNARICQHVTPSSLLRTQRKPAGSRWETFEVLTVVCCDVKFPRCWILKMEALESFDMSGTIVPTSQHKFPEDLDLLEADICIWRAFPYSPKFLSCSVSDILSVFCITTNTKQQESTICCDLVHMYLQHTNSSQCLICLRKVVW
jgi:hypothetical protein